MSTEETLFITDFASPLENLTLRSDGERLVGVCFDGQTRKAHVPAFERDGADLPEIKRTVRWLELFFGGKIPDFTPPMRLCATQFCREVCEILCTIPYGKTTTYGEIAQILAARRGIKRMSAQAVGGAIGSNPIAIIIPCHRVIGANGALIGYGGGLERKAALLRLEKETIEKEKGGGTT